MTFDATNLKFTLESSDHSIKNKKYIITISAQASLSGTATNSFSFSVTMNSNQAPPEFESELESYEVTQGKSLSITLPNLRDVDGDDFEILSESYPKTILSGSFPKYSISTRLTTAPGYYFIVIEVKDKNLFPLSAKYAICLTVVQAPPPPPPPPATPPPAS